MDPQHEHKPYVPADTTLPEITVPTVLLAITLSMILAAANAYLGLFAGMTVSASIPAAVLAMAILRAFGGNILQFNAVQTSASAGEALAGGVIFTMPALLLLGTWNDFHFLETTLLAGMGGTLGVLFTIPLRRALIVEQPLQFPEGVATSAVLKAGDKNTGDTKYLVLSGLIGGVFKYGIEGKLFAGAVHYGRAIGGSAFAVGSYLSPALVAVGYIVGLNIALLIALGGATNWLVAIPIVTAGELAPGANAFQIAEGVWSEQTRYLGVGAMLVGGIWALVRLMPVLVRSLRTSIAAFRSRKGGTVLRTERDMSMTLVLGLSAASLLPLWAISYHFIGSAGMSMVMAVFMLVAGFLFSAVAAYMAGLVGSSNNPISGITIATVLCASLLLKLLGIDSDMGPAAAIFIGSVVCCAAAIGGDNMQDLKAGHIVGSTPRNLQIMQFVGVAAAMFVMAPVLNALDAAYGIGEGLKAPQAMLMNSVSSGIFNGGLPWDMIGIGAGIAAVIIGFDLMLERAGSSFRMPVLAYAVGIYLPIDLAVPILLGGIVARFAKRARKRSGDHDIGDEISTGDQRGTLFAAGLITGEALIGIALAVPIVLSEDRDIVSFVDNGDAVLPGVILLAGVVTLLFRAATSGKPSEGLDS